MRPAGPDGLCCKPTVECLSISIKWEDLVYSFENPHNVVKDPGPSVLLESKERADGGIFQNKGSIIGWKRHLNISLCSVCSNRPRIMRCIIKIVSALCRKGNLLDCRHTDMKPDRMLHQTKPLWHWRTHMQKDIYMSQLVRWQGHQTDASARPRSVWQRRKK